MLIAALGHKRIELAGRQHLIVSVQSGPASQMLFAGLDAHCDLNHVVKYPAAPSMLAVLRASLN